MGSATVRAAVKAYLDHAIELDQIPGVKKIYSAPPYWADGADWNMDDGLGSAAVGAVHLGNHTESRITVPALTGEKAIHYDVYFLLFYQWMIRSGTLAPTEADQWAGPLDDTLDAVKTLIRADPNLGNPAVIFQAGQGIEDGEGPDIKVMTEVPRRTAGKVLVFTSVQFAVTEILTA